MVIESMSSLWTTRIVFVDLKNANSDLALGELSQLMTVRMLSFHLTKTDLIPAAMAALLLFLTVSLMFLLLKQTCPKTARLRYLS